MSDKNKIDEKFDLDKLKEELALAQKKAEEHLAGWQRARADYLNLKKDNQREKEELIKFSNAALVMALLPIKSNFKKAWQHLPEEHKEDEWFKGVSQIKKQLDDFFESLGIKEIKTDGQIFNPEFHEAMHKEKLADKKSGEIIKEIEPGYLMHDKVIYPAKVVVAE